MKLLIDMNLSPAWVEALRRNGFESVHWSAVGDPRASDAEIFRWAGERGYVVFTHDLDFSAILAASHAQLPSVVQVRTRDTLPGGIEATLVSALRRFSQEIETGAILVIEEGRQRVRILPLRKP